MQNRVFIEDARGRLMDIESLRLQVLAHERVRLASYLVAGVDLITRRALLSSASPLPAMLGAGL